MTKDNGISNNDKLMDLEIWEFFELYEKKVGTSSFLRLMKFFRRIYRANNSFIKTLNFDYAEYGVKRQFLCNYGKKFLLVCKKSCNKAIKFLQDNHASKVPANYLKVMIDIFLQIAKLTTTFTLYSEKAQPLSIYIKELQELELTVLKATNFKDVCSEGCFAIFKKCKIL